MVHDSALPLFVLNMELMLEESEVVPKIILSLLKAGGIRIALFNEAVMQVFTTMLEISSGMEEFER